MGHNSSILLMQAIENIGGFHLWMTLWRCPHSAGREILANFPQADFWQSSLRVRPGHNFRLARGSPREQSVTQYPYTAAKCKLV